MKKFDEKTLIDNDIINAPEVTEKVDKPLEKNNKEEKKKCVSQNRQLDQSQSTESLSTDQTAQIIAKSVGDTLEKSGVMTEGAREAINELVYELSRMTTISPRLRIPLLSIAVILPLTPSIFKIYKEYKKPKQSDEVENGLNA